MKTTADAPIIADDRFRAIKKKNKKKTFVSNSKEHLFEK